MSDVELIFLRNRRFANLFCRWWYCEFWL